MMQGGVVAGGGGYGMVGGGGYGMVGGGGRVVAGGAVGGQGMVAGGGGGFAGGAVGGQGMVAGGGGYGMATSSGTVMVGGATGGQGVVAGGGAGVIAGGGGVIGGTVVSGGGAGCAGACGGAEVACCDAEGAITSVNWRYVGAGGNYNKTQSYNYVGEGQGQFVQEEVVTYYGWKMKPMCIGLLGLVLIVIVAVIFWPPEATTTTTVVTTTAVPTAVLPFLPPPGTCLFWGDPHILTFDGARPSFYGEGDFWVVKSPRVSIQGRFMGTKYTHGLSATNQIAVGGDFVNGNVIIVGSMDDGTPTVNGQPVLQSLGSTYSLNGGGTLTYNTDGELPDKAAAVFPKNVVHMDLPNEVKIEVFRFANYIDLRIQMPPQGNQDGCCGNFNKSPADDTTAQIFDRIGARVPPAETLFPDQPQVTVTTEMQTMIASNCEEARLAAGKMKCQSEVPAGAARAELDACVFDYCFGRNEHALRTAKTYG